MELKTDAELRQLAADAVEGRVFGSWMVGDTASLPLVFMPLALGAQLPKDTQHVYEYLEKAGPRGINGYPSFFSFHVLVKDEAERLQPLIDELVEQKKAFLEST